jgi:Radical SAM superfamily/B12 binding domain
MTLKVILLHSDDDGFSLGVEMLRATVRERLPGGECDHRVWFHPPTSDLTSDYLGQYNLLLARLFSWRPDVLAFSVYVWNHDEFARIAQLVKRHLPDTTILWGGGQMSSRKMAGRLLRTCPWLDIVVRGEAEDSYPELLRALGQGAPLTGIAGVSWRRGGEPVHNEDAAKVDLRRVPVVFDPAHLDLPAVIAQRSTRTIAYETGRGCRQRCKFCLYGIPALRSFSMDRVDRELAYVLRSRPPFLRVCDAHFGISRPRAMEIFEIIAAHNEDTIVEIYPDTRHVDRDYVTAMNRAGCRVISLGIQSSDAGTLALAQRRFDTQTFARAARLIREGHNPELAADVIIGMPGDNYGKVAQSIDFAFANGISKVHFAPLMGFPGTEYYEHAEQFGLEFMPFQPPLAVESHGFPADAYRSAMVLAARVEMLQEQLPTLLRCIVAAGARVTDLLRDLPCELDDRPLADSPMLAERLATRWPGAAGDLARDGLAWDRCLLRQAREPLRLAWPAGKDRLAAPVAGRVLSLRYPVHALAADPFLTGDRLAPGEYRYVFPCGGVAVYPVEGPLAVALDAVSPGQTLDDWRAAVQRNGGDWPAPVLGEAVGVLLAAGVVEAAGAGDAEGAAPASTAAAAR